MEVIDLLLDHGSLGIFAAFLIWLYTSMQKRMDLLVENFQKQLVDIRKEYKEDVKEIRDRYDEVIEGLNKESLDLRSNIAVEVKSIRSRIDGINGNIDIILISQSDMNVTVADISKISLSISEDIEDISKNVEHGLSTMNELKENERLRTLTKQVLINK